MDQIDSAGQYDNKNTRYKVTYTKVTKNTLHAIKTPYQYKNKAM